ncbi:heavy metal-associated isoprenylated plant protein 16-like [Curcuma longa]|uniref:heavy metal-associated isoprenylated plant protein 16-like n=1 Tax=Curcuma longa TaxID=136217 RepID=UPI003D9DCDEE
MAKQKVVLKVVAMEDAKRRSKALKTAVGLPGVLSASLDKDCLIVVGDGVDSVVLATALRRKMGSADLVSVGSAEEKKEEKKPATAVAEADKITWQPPPVSYWTMYPAAPQLYNHYQYPY